MPCRHICCRAVARLVEAPSPPRPVPPPPAVGAASCPRPPPCHAPTSPTPQPYDTPSPPTEQVPLDDSAPPPPDTSPPRSTTEGGITARHHVTFPRLSTEGRGTGLRDRPDTSRGLVHLHPTMDPPGPPATGVGAVPLPGIVWRARAAHSMSVTASTSASMSRPPTSRASATHIPTATPTRTHAPPGLPGTGVAWAHHLHLLPLTPDESQTVTARLRPPRTGEGPHINTPIQGDHPTGPPLITGSPMEAPEAPGRACTNPTARRTRTTGASTAKEQKNEGGEEERKRREERSLSVSPSSVLRYADLNEG